MNITQLILEAVSYWERKRIIYNFVLALLSALCWGVDILSSAPEEWFVAGVVLLVFAMIANVLYCVVYPVDLIMQLTPFRETWKSSRWLPFCGGLLIASGLAWWILQGHGMA